MSQKPDESVEDVADVDDLDLQELADRLRENVEIEDRKYRLKTYEDCFVGEEAVDWLVGSGIASDRQQAVAVGDLLREAGVFHHVLRDHDFEDDYLFYRFASDEDHGAVVREGDAPVSWSDLLPERWRRAVGAEALQPQIPVYDDEMPEMQRVESIGVEPLDEHNVELLDNVHPREWSNPEPESTYNLVVIGAGTGGLVAAASAAGLGAKVALIEENLMGGDCLNFGCVPSKALLRSAHAVAEIRRASELGVHVDGEVRVDFGEVMERLRARRAEIAPHDSAERFADELGVDVFIGRATFTSKKTVEVDGQELSFSRACIATGAAPVAPPIEGLAEVPFLTNHTLYNLTELPPRMGVIGGGVIGVEMSQAFQRLGAQVTVFERNDSVLPREDPDAAEIVQSALVEDGVELVFGAEITSVAHDPAGDDQAFPTIRVHREDGGVHEFDALLVATGRKPNVEGMGLEEAGVDFDLARGVHVDDRLQTSNSRIYAVGDVSTKYKFTHAADFMARIVVRNALFFGREKFSDLLIPWCTYTEPEVAHVGLYPRDLEERGKSFDTYTKHFADVDRAIVDEATEGFVRVYTEEGGDEILGATIVGPHAGDMISEVTLAIQSGTGLSKIADVIHPYPTKAEAIRHLGDMYNRTRLTTTVKKILRQVLALRR